MRRLTPPLVAITVAATLVMALAGCGGSSKPQGRTFTGRITPGSTTVAHRPGTITAPTAAQIRRAALLTAAKPGYRAGVRAQIALPSFNGNALTAVGSGHFDSGTQTGTLHLAVTLPGLLGLAGSLPTEVIASGADVYFQVPSEFSVAHSGLPGWLEASLSGLDLGTLSPSVILRQIARDATRRVAGQRARVTIDARTGLIQTILLTYYDRGARAHVTVRLRLTGFGPEPASSAPPASEVGQLASALQGLGL